MGWYYDIWILSKLPNLFNINLSPYYENKTFSIAIELNRCIDYVWINIKALSQVSNEFTKQMNINATLPCKWHFTFHNIFNNA